MHPPHRSSSALLKTGPGLSYAWLMAFMATYASIASIPGQTAGVSAFTDYLIAAYGVSRNQLSFAYMAGTIASSLCLPWAGRLLDRWGGRKMIVVAALGLAGSLALLANGPDLAAELTVAGPWALLLSGFAFFGIRHFGQGQFTMIARTLMGLWFQANLGVVSGVTGILISFAFGAAPLILIHTIESLGWYHGMLSLIAVALSCGVLGAVLIKAPPQAQSSPPSSRGEVDRRNFAREDRSLVEVKQSLEFWLYNLALALQAAVITAFTFHFSKIAKELLLDPKEAFGVFIPVAVVGTLTNLVAGYLSDRAPLRGQLILLLFAMSLAIGASPYLDHPFGYAMIALGFGVAGGLHSCLMVVAWPKLYGTKELGAISGYNLGWVVFGSAIGPYLVSVLYDWTSYLYAAFACLTVLPLVLLACVLLGPPHKAQSPTG